MNFNEVIIWDFLIHIVGKAAENLEFFFLPEHTFFMNCVFCNSFYTEIKKIGNRHYNFCADCGGISVLPKYFMAPAQQKQRYLLHKNTLENEGYLLFLKNFIDPILEKINCINFIVDYGCGPTPCLLQLLDRYRTSEKIPQSVRLYGWDPFFQPELPHELADLVTCLEVAEHFENPAVDFEKLASVCHSGGYVAVGTKIWQQPMECFETWWYKEDLTHVSFYSEYSLCLCAQRVSLQLIEKISDDAFLFKKL